MRGFTPLDGDQRATVVVGEGLIGSAISARLQRLRTPGEWHRPTAWSDPASLGQDLIDAVDPAGRERPLDLIWSAGGTGMTMSTDDTSSHGRFFARALGDLIEAWAGPVRVHHVSSAGALGPPGGTDRFATGGTPYAEIKAREEEALVELVDDAVVYRVSSVFGAPRPGARAGAIGVLVDNSLRGHETLLHARSTTMRNYLHAPDVAEAILRNRAVASEPIVLVAAARSHPMYEVISLVAQVTRRPVPICYRPPANDHDMVFDPRLRSPLVPERSLLSGIKLVYDGILAR